MMNQAAGKRCGRLRCNRSPNGAPRLPGGSGVKRLKTVRGESVIGKRGAVSCQLSEVTNQQPETSNQQSEGGTALRVQSAVKRDNSLMKA